MALKKKVSEDSELVIYTDARSIINDPEAIRLRYSPTTCYAIVSNKPFVCNGTEYAKGDLVAAGRTPEGYIIHGIKKNQLNIFKRL